ncbi:MAG TPA: aldehyde dehydrogenase family protein [Candidatus Xenobia bacterium]|jgi:betaine-aldehyde dehydrogenase
MKQMFIDGEWVGPKNGGGIQVIDPATEQVVDSVPSATVDDVERAVDAANRAFKQWGRMTGIQRGELLHLVAEAIEAKKEDLARILTLEGGKPLRENRDEVGWVASCFRYYAEIGRNRRGRVIPSVEQTQLSMVLKEPFGVTVCIVPYNYPLLLMSWKVAPALAAGNTIIIKPSSITPMSTLALGEIFSILPKGTVNILTGGGKDIGDRLVSHARTHLIAFTGSLETGRHIAHLAAERIKKVSLELGSKDPFIVCDDADPEIAAKAVAWASYLNCGQVCTSTERVYVDQKISKQFIEALVEFTKKLNIGNGMDDATDVGPMARDHYRQKVERQVENAVKDGAKVLVGGKRPKDKTKGFFYEPTVMVDVRHDMEIMKDETFGPVAPVMTFKTFDEAIALADDTVFGLGAICYTKDAAKAKKFFEEVKAGSVWINDPLTDNDAGPFGGMRMSGLGRELGEEGLDEFCETKHVHWDFVMEEKDWWYPYKR